MKITACVMALLAGIPTFAAPPDHPICLVGRRTSKLDTIIIPRIDLREVTVSEAIEFVRMKAKQLDPEGVGINIVLKLPAEPSPTPAQKVAPVRPR
jgi:hypothetical protein